MTDLREQATVLAMTEVSPRPWHEVATLIEDAGGTAPVLGATAPLLEDSQVTLGQTLAELITSEKIDHWAEVINDTLSAFPDASLLTVLDDGYPDNLRKVFNHPPFLFVRGELLEQDARSVAVVGTRQASPEGLRRAYDLASQLAARGVTVISGLAAGIDTSAHSGSLDAGGRTIAVMGTGIDRVYPRQNAELAERIPLQGALVSQFWPGAPPKSSKFPSSQRGHKRYRCWNCGHRGQFNQWRENASSTCS